MTSGDPVIVVSIRDEAVGKSRTIEATLDVGVDLLVLEAAASEVDDFDCALGWMFEQDVLQQ
jgi:hypothetical protein